MKKSEIAPRVIDKVNNALAELPNYTRVGSRVHSEGRYAFVDGIIGNASFSVQIRLNAKYPSIDAHIKVRKHKGCGAEVEINKTYFDLRKYADLEQVKTVSDLFKACSIINED